MNTGTYWTWPLSSGPVLLAQTVVWSVAGREFRGQAAELWDEEGIAVVDANDGNRWHFDLKTGEIIRRFPIPLAQTGTPDAFAVIKG